MNNKFGFFSPSLKEEEVLLELFINNTEFIINKIIINPDKKYRQYALVVAKGDKVYDIDVGRLVLIPNFIDLREEKKFAISGKEYLILNQKRLVAELE